MITEAEFLRAIAADPEDLAVWCVFGDWLEERGDFRAKYVRKNCRRQTLPTLERFHRLQPQATWPKQDRRSATTKAQRRAKARRKAQKAEQEMGVLMRLGVESSTIVIMTSEAQFQADRLAVGEQPRPV